MKKGIFSLNKKSFLALVCLFMALIISSCPTPITNDMLNQVKDDIGLVIILISPNDGSAYATLVEVTVKVTGTSQVDSAGSVSSVSYEVLSTTITSEVILADNGSFSFPQTDSLPHSFVQSLSPTRTVIQRKPQLPL